MDCAVELFVDLPHLRHETLHQLLIGLGFERKMPRTSQDLLHVRRRWLLFSVELQPLPQPHSSTLQLPFPPERHQISRLQALRHCGLFWQLPSSLFPSDECFVNRLKCFVSDLDMIEAFVDSISNVGHTLMMKFGKGNPPMIHLLDLSSLFPQKFCFLGQGRQSAHLNRSGSPARGGGRDSN
jgi:hypothetical protein